MSKLDEMMATGEAAYSDKILLTPVEEEMRRYLSAILRTHIQPMIAEAYNQGSHDGVECAQSPRPCMCDGKFYASRIISESVSD